MNDSIRKSTSPSEMAQNVDALSLLFNIAMIASAVFIVMLTDNDSDGLAVIGYSLIGIASLYCIKYRNARRLAVVIMLISLINLNVAFSVCLNPEQYVASWQVYIYKTSANVLVGKSLLLFSTCFFAFLGNAEKDERSISEEMKASFAVNDILIVAGSAAVLYILVFGIDRGTVGSYSSNTNTLYEYAIVLYIFLWIYSPANTAYHGFLLLYAALYVAQGLLYGDRSSAFPMLIAVYMLVSKRQVKLLPMVLIGLCGIVFSNCIDILRNGESLSLESLVELGFYSNTVSYSYYGGTAITLYGSSSLGHLSNLFNNILATFVGSSSISTNLAVEARTASTAYFNRGGGFTATYAYYWLGYFGSVIVGSLMGYVTGRLSRTPGLLANVLFACVTCFAIRWYVYYPIAFTRTALFIPWLVYFVFGFFKIDVSEDDHESEREPRHKARMISHAC